MKNKGLGISVGERRAKAARITVRKIKIKASKVKSKKRTQVNRTEGKRSGFFFMSLKELSHSMERSTRRRWVPPQPDSSTERHITL